MIGSSGGCACGQIVCLVIGITIGTLLIIAIIGRIIIAISFIMVIRGRMIIMMARIMMMFMGMIIISSIGISIIVIISSIIMLQRRKTGQRHQCLTNGKIK